MVACPHFPFPVPPLFNLPWREGLLLLARLGPALQLSRCPSPSTDKTPRPRPNKRDSTNRPESAQTLHGTPSLPCMLSAPWGSFASPDTTLTPR